MRVDSPEQAGMTDFPSDNSAASTAPLALAGPLDRERQRKLMKRARRIRQARACLVIVAIFMTASNVTVTVALYDGALGKSALAALWRSLPLALLLGSWAWSHRSPAPAFGSAMALLTVVIGANLLASPQMTPFGAVLGLAILAFLFRGFLAAIGALSAQRKRGTDRQGT